MKFNSIFNKKLNKIILKILLTIILSTGYFFILNCIYYKTYKFNYCFYSLERIKERNYNLFNRNGINKTKINGYNTDNVADNIVIDDLFIKKNIFKRNSFSKNDLFLKNKFLFLGDFIPHKSVRIFLENFKINDALKFVSDIGEKDSLIFYNLETTILDNPEKAIPFIFSYNKNLIYQLKMLNIRNFTIANNHILDYGEEGFIQTIKNIKNENFTGIINNGNLYVKKINYNQKTIGFVGITFIMNDPHGVFSKLKKNKIYPSYYLFTEKNRKIILKKIKSIKYENNNVNRNKIKNNKNSNNNGNNNIDFLIVSIHWGKEYEPIPYSAQIEFAKKLIDNGADIVWGHHPHIIQPLLIYKNKPIIFSNGNFFSAQALSKTSVKDKSIHKNYFYTRVTPVIEIYYNYKYLKKIKISFYFVFKNKKSIFLLPLKELAFTKRFFIDEDLKFNREKVLFNIKKQILQNCELKVFGVKIYDLKKSYFFAKNTFFYFFNNNDIYKNNTFVYKIVSTKHGYTILFYYNEFNK